MSDPPAVLDASALLALLQNEPGAEVVAGRLPQCVMSAVNLSEVVAKLVDRGLPEADLRAALDVLDIDVRDFDTQAAYAAGELRRITQGAGLSLATAPASRSRCASAPRRSPRTAAGPHSPDAHCALN